VVNNADVFLQEREWVPLWLAGPIVGLLGVIGSIAIVWSVLAVWQWLQGVIR